TNIVVKNTDPIIGAQTDLDGNYEIKIEPGTYDLEVSYVGYAVNLIQGVVVTANEITVLDFPMVEEGLELQEVVVQAERIDRTENAMLMLQKKSITVQDGISAQEIGRTGSSNAASAMKKVTGASVVDGKFIYVRGLGDRYSSAQLNGLQLPSTDPYRNSTQLDLIPANLLDNIVASKTFTPDQPANFTGGNVNIKTKSFPERFTLSASISTTYNTQSSFKDDFLTHEGGGTDWLGFDDGARAIPSELDTAFTNNVGNTAHILARFGDGEIADLVDAGSKALNPQRTGTTKSTPMDYGVSFSVGNQYKLFNNPLGFMFGINYSRSFTAYQNGSLQYWELTDAAADSLNINRNLSDNIGTESPQLGGLLGLAYKFGQGNKISFNLLYNHDAEKTTRYLAGPFPAIISGNGIFETSALFFKEREVRSYQLAGEHVIGASGIKFTWGGGFVQSSQEEPDFRQFSNTFNVRDDGDTLYFISAAEHDLPWHFWRNLEDEQITGKFDLSIPIFKDRNKTNKIQFGMAYANKDREFSDNVFQIQTSHTGPQPYDGDPEKFFGDENIGVVDFNPDNGRYTLGLYPINFEKSTRENSYTGRERSIAGYGMFVYSFDKLMVIGGARAETTDIFVESRDTSREAGEIDELDILPSLSLIYKLNEQMNLRGSFSQTLARPNMRELAPFQSFDFGGDFRIQGNPELQRTKAQNYDLRWEYFPQPGEVIAVSAYYKNFSNPIIKAFLPISGNPLIEYQNVDQATVYGMELEFRKNLGFITPAFEKLRFSTNFSLIESQVDISPEEVEIIEEFNPEKGDTRPFQGQSPYLLNVGLNYVDQASGFDAMLSFNIFGDRLSEISQGRNPDVYEKSRAQLGLFIKKRWNNGFAIRVSADNLLNAVYKRTMTFKDAEYIIQEYRRGVTFGLGLSYTI
ncbi:MAG: TonB-dependent receptor, partial [Bacteroidota bacterium]